MDVVQTEEYLTRMLAGGFSLSGFFNSTPARCTVRLYKNDYTPAGNDPTANFEEADFNGYAAFDTPTSPGATLVLDGSLTPYVSFGVSADFDAVAPTSPQIIYGHMIDLFGASGHIFTAVRFPQPITIDTPGQRISVIPVVPITRPQLVGLNFDH